MSSYGWMWHHLQPLGQPRSIRQNFAHIRRHWIKGRHPWERNGRDRGDVQWYTGDIHGCIIHINHNNGSNRHYHWQGSGRYAFRYASKQSRFPGSLILSTQPALTLSM
jgi:hypothetical protein